MKDNTHKAIVVLMLLLVAVIIDLTTNIVHIANYDNQKAAGNARWEQVEERIIDLEERIEELENK